MTWNGFFYNNSGTITVALLGLSFLGGLVMVAPVPQIVATVAVYVAAIAGLGAGFVGAFHYGKLHGEKVERERILNSQEASIVGAEQMKKMEFKTNKAGQVIGQSISRSIEQVDSISLLSAKIEQQSAKIEQQSAKIEQQNENIKNMKIELENTQNKLEDLEHHSAKQLAEVERKVDDSFREQRQNNLNSGPHTLFANNTGINRRRRQAANEDQNEMNQGLALLS